MDNYLIKVEFSGQIDFGVQANSEEEAREKTRKEWEKLNFNVWEKCDEFDEKYHVIGGK